MKVFKQDGVVVGVQFKDVDMAGIEGDGEATWIQIQGPIHGFYTNDGATEFGLRVADPCILDYSSDSLVYDGSNSLQVLGYPENSYAAWHTI